MAPTSYPSPSEKIFLTAEWLNLAMLNYQVDPSLLLPHIPLGTELDFWNGRTFISLVGFRFLKTKVFGISFPFHRDFDEINLRFYVKRREGNEIRRGVVFIKEIVPRWAIAAAARAFYGENYVSLPMSHKIQADDRQRISVDYAWKSHGAWKKMTLQTSGKPELPAENSEEQFITEHYWGYAAQKNSASIEYRVNHPSWKVWATHSAHFVGDPTHVYGPALAAALKNPPSSAFLAQGSPVTVHRGRRL
jgi:uncharacterized protein YqjF (DUF2071 family)